MSFLIGGGGSTPEQIQDNVATALTNTASLTFTYNDVGNSISGDVQSNSTTQKVEVAKAATLVGTRKRLNLIEGSNITLTVADNAGSDRVDVTVASSGVSFPLLASDGSAAAPSYSFSSDSDTGLYRDSNGHLAYTRNSTPVLAIDSTTIKFKVDGQVEFNSAGSTIIGMNGTRLRLQTGGDQIQLNPNSGSTLNLQVRSDQLRFAGASGNGHVTWETDNTSDIGSADAGATNNRPRNIYVGTSIRNAEGTSALPSYTFKNSDAYDDGLWYVAADEEMGLSTSGSKRLTMDNGAVYIYNCTDLYLTNGNTLSASNRISFTNTQINIRGSSSLGLRAGTNGINLLSTSATLESGMHLIWENDGSEDIGTSSANRPRRVYAKTGVHVNESAPASAILSAASTTQGFLPPRMTTTERDAIASPAAGLMIYNTTTNKLNVYTTAWEVITSA